MIGCGVSIGKTAALLRTIPHRVKAILNKYGDNAHLYLPGVSVTGGFIPGNYIDSAGTQPAVYDQPVGLVLDAAGSVGTDLVANGSFAVDSGWTKGAGVTISGGVCNIAAGAGYLEQAIPTASGKTYWVTATNAGNAVYSGAWSSSGQSGALSGSPGGRGVGTNKFEFVATGSTSYIGFTATGAGALTIDNVIVREVTGIHASQQTVGYKPTLRRGIVNLLTWSNDLSNAAWSIKSAGATATSNSVSFTTDPSSRVLHTYTHIPGAATIAASFSGADVGKTVRLAVWDSVLDGLTTGKSGALIIPASGVVVFNITLSGGAGYVGVVGDATPVTLSNPSVAIFAGTLTAAQILAAGGIPLTTTVPASSQAGPNYLEFDGVDDNLVTGGGTDTSGVLCLGCKPSSLAYMTPLGSGAINGTNAGVAIKFRNNGDIWFRSSNGALANDTIASAAYSVGAPLVVAVTWTPAAQKIRINSSEKNSSPCFSALSATNLVIGKHDSAAGAEYFKGAINVAVYIKGTVSDADLLVLEKFVASLSGVTL